MISLPRLAIRVCAILFLVSTVSLVSSASAVVRQEAISTAAYPIGLAHDAAGNVYIANENDGTLTVVPAVTGTLFGQSVTAGQESTLVRFTSSQKAVGLAVDAQNDLLYSRNDGSVFAITAAARTIFGVTTVANIPTLIISGTSMLGPLEFDTAGNLYGVALSRGKLFVLPAATGTLFGVSVTANTPTQIFDFTSRWLWDVAIDPAGNILVSDGWSVSPGVYMLPHQDATVYGEVVTANTFVKLAAFGSDRRAGIDSDAVGNIFVAAYGSHVDVYSPTGGSMFGQAIAPESLTRLSETARSGITNQGVLITGAGDLVTGGANATYRTYADSPTPTPTPTLTSTPTPTLTSTPAISELSKTGRTNPVWPPVIGAASALIVGAMLLRKFSRPKNVVDSARRKSRLKP